MVHNVKAMCFGRKYIMETSEDFVVQLGHI